MRELFTLKRSSPERSDCTASYEVKISKECTVQEFLSGILSHNKDWGNIYILREGENISYILTPQMKYSYGKITKDQLMDVYLNCTVTSAKADGGWSRMDYYIFTKE